MEGMERALGPLKKLGGAWNYVAGSWKCFILLDAFNPVVGGTSVFTLNFFSNLIVS